MTATAAKAPAAKASAGGKRGVFQDKEKPAHIRLSNIEAAKVHKLWLFEDISFSRTSSNGTCKYEK